MISNFIGELATHLGIDIKLHIQEPAVSTGTFPFGSYKILQTNFKPAHCRIREQIPKPGNMIDIKNYYGIETVIQLNFYNKGNTGDLLDDILKYAQQAWLWINEGGRTICRQYNIVPAIISPQITEEKDLEHNDQICRVGFDFALRGTLEYTSPVESIITVDYNGTAKT